MDLLSVQNKNRDMREAALVGMVDGVLTELKSFPKSTGVVNVRRYVELALFPFAMNQVIHPLLITKHIYTS